MEDREKIIEIYATTDKEKGKINLEIERIVDTDVSNAIMRDLMRAYSNL